MTGQSGAIQPLSFSRFSHRPWNSLVRWAFFDWAASKGLDRKKVEDTYKSFGIAGKIGRAKQTAQTYNIQSVPTLVVDGKFMVSSGTAGTHERVPGALDAAIAVARAERPK